MADQQRDVSPGPNPRSVRGEEGQLLKVPRHWVLVPPGDPALTRRVKRAGPSWTVKETRGRRTFSLGVWADETTVRSIREALEGERADPAYKRKLDSARRRRGVQQERYAEDFEHAVTRFLSFAPEYEALGSALARAITRHAIPVGSGTVARTQRISLERRAEAATIAWLRHHTTTYDGMHMGRGRGERREVRRMLATLSRELLHRYRMGEPVRPERCPLRAALPGLVD